MAGAPSGQDELNTARRRIPDAAAFFFCLLFLAAWPWEMHQRLPWGGTAVSLAGLGLLFSGGWLFLNSPKRGALSGYEAPLALLLLACAQSWTRSADAPATAALLKQYALYTLLFFAALPVFRRPGQARTAWIVLTVSAALVGVTALLCARGLLTPALAMAQRYLDQRLADEIRAGAFIRMAATTPDFNQAILPMLLCLPLAMAMAAWPDPARPRTVRAAGGILSLALLCGVVVSLSRSGLIAVAGLAAAGVVVLPRGRTRRGAWMLAGLALAAAALLGWLAVSGYLDASITRMRRMFDDGDPSSRSRLYVFGLAWRLLPEYFWLGCGLGASPKVIGAAADPAVWQGTAIHSMPGLFLFETGILGLAGYLWLWARWGRRAWRRWRAAATAEARLLHGAMLGSGAVLFWILAIQPFQALSLFPVFGALAAALSGGTALSAENTAAPRRRWAPLLAGAVTLAVVAPNMAWYETVAARMNRFAAALDAALEAEKRGDWESAGGGYALAAEQAKACRLGEPGPGQYYRHIASGVSDLGYVLDRIPGGGPRDAGADIAEFGRARILHNQGDYENAAALLEEICVRQKGWADPAYALGEARWRRGDKNGAAAAWKDAAARLKIQGRTLPPKPPAEARTDLTDVAAALEAELGRGDQATDRREMLLLRLGR